MRLMMPDPPTGTITFLFTDIESSTRLWEAYPDAMGPAVARHGELLREIIEAHGGYVFKTRGDSICAALTGADAALESAIEAQKALLREPWGAMEPLRVRMALHTGTAEYLDGDYFGQPLNRIARVLHAGHGGQTLLSHAAAHLVREALPNKASLKDLGTHRLKDLQQPEQIFQLLHPELPVEFPPLRSLESFAHNLPRQLTSFIGRDHEIAEIRRLLLPRNEERGTRNEKDTDVSRSSFLVPHSCPLVTLTGAGGCGKTRLALQTAADLVEEYEDGAWFVEFAALSDSSLVPQTLASALGVREEPGRPLIATLTGFLRPRSLLLLLDNCEHLITACARLAGELLQACPNLRILATSREGLGIPGELTYQVPPLSLPPGKRSAGAHSRPADSTAAGPVSTLSRSDAATLFIERAHSRDAGFAVNERNATAVVDVCRRLDGIPLALELAAAWVHVLTVGQIADRLDDRFRFLRRGSRIAPPRQQTLQALVDWSYALLSDAERLLLARLSLFAGGWSLEAATTICSGKELEEYDVLDLLGSLVEKSLVIADETGSGEMRYRMLETIRAYGRDRLEEFNEISSHRSRHRDWYLQMAEAAERGLYGTEQPEWLERMDVEHDNLRAALDWCVESGDAETGLRLGDALGEFWHMRSHLSEGRERLARMLALPGAHEHTMARAGALAKLGRLSLNLSDWDTARSAYEEAAALYRVHGDKSGLAAAFGGQGFVAFNQGDSSASQALMRQSLSLAREAGDQRQIIGTLYNYGFAISWQGEYETARALLEESIALCRELGDQLNLSYALSFRGQVAAFEGDRAGVHLFAGDSLAIAREIGNRSMIASSLHWLAYDAIGAAEYRAARALAEEGLEIARELGVHTVTGAFLTDLGRLSALQGEFEAAERFYLESLEVVRVTGEKVVILDSLEGLARVALRSGSDEGSPERSARLLGVARALREAAGLPLPPAAHEEYDGMVEALRMGLGEDRFQRLWGEGEAMTIAQAIADTLRPGAG